MIDAAGPIQELAETGGAPALTAQLKKLEAAASGSKSNEITNLVSAAKRLGELVEEGSKPAKAGEEHSLYASQKAYRLENFVNGRRDVARVCK